MATYTITTNEAERTEHGFTVRYNLAGSPLPRIEVEARNMDELNAHCTAQAFRALDENPDLPGVKASPLLRSARHINGGKNYPGQLIMRTDDAYINHRKVLASLAGSA